MKIVVKKVPKFLRGFVKLVFGIKENTEEEEKDKKEKNKEKEKIRIKGK